MNLTAKAVFAGAACAFVLLSSSTAASGGVTADRTMTQSIATSAEVPSPPTNLRVERDAQGFIQFFRWDRPAGVDGPLTYFLWMESDPQFFGPGAVENTSQLVVNAYQTPVCDGCQYGPEQTIFVWVVAANRHGYSPPSNRLTIHCCPF